MISTCAASNRALRLLFLLPHVPGLDGMTGGARSTAHLIAGLSEKHEVAVLCLRRPHDPPAEEALRRACAAFEEVPTDPVARDRSWWQKGRLRALPLVRTPAWALRTDVLRFRERLRSLAGEWRPDIVHIGYHVMGQYACELGACAAPRVLTQYEPGITAARDTARGCRGLARLRARLETETWARFERRVMRQVDAIVVLTERDGRTLAPLAGSVPIVRIPLGVGIPAQSLNPLGAEPPRVVFVGNFIHRPNVDAALWLMHSIFPQVLQARPDARLLVVGPGPTAEIRRMAGASVTVTGAVESLSPLLNAASVVVAPVRRGGGMRVKVMEALAGGKAVVATPLAVEGLDVTTGRQLIVAERESDFASAVIRLLDDPVERVGLALRARKWASGHLGWDRTIAAYDGLHEDLLSAAPVARRTALARAADRVTET